MDLVVVWGFHLLPVAVLGLWHELAFEQFDSSTKFQLGMLKQWLEIKNKFTPRPYNSKAKISHIPLMFPSSIRECKYSHGSEVG